MSDAPHIAVIGGGVTGLAAARQLCRSSIGGQPPRVTLLESSNRLGGKVRSEQFAGATVDLGPEALFTAMPAGLRLCRELGLDDQLVAPLRSSTAVWTRGRLRELSPGILGGLPDGIGPILRSGILSPAGFMRAGADLLLPEHNGHHDESVGSLVRRRLGDQALERMIDPLLGGIYGGDPDALSLRATAPRLHALASEHRSLIRGLMVAGRNAPTSSGPMFMTLPGGLQRLIDGLESDLGHTEVLLGAGVRRIVPLDDDNRRYLITTTTGRELTVAGAVIATPAPAAADMLRRSAPAAADELASIEYASIAVVWLAFRPQSVPPLPERSGFLVPRADGRALSACTWASAKWPHLAAHSDHVLFRCSVGRGHPELLAGEDQALVDAIVAELREAIGVRDNPVDAHVTRWHRAMPQYTVGHLERLERLTAALEPLPRIRLAGAAYHGMGVPQCIAQGEDAAAEIASVEWPAPLAAARGA